VVILERFSLYTGTYISNNPSRAYLL